MLFFLSYCSQESIKYIFVFTESQIAIATFNMLIAYRLFP